MDELTLGLIGAGAVVVGGVVVYNAWQSAKVRRKMPRPMPADAAESFARDDHEEQSPFIEPARPTTRREPVVGADTSADTASARVEPTFGAPVGAAPLDTPADIQAETTTPNGFTPAGNDDDAERGASAGADKDAAAAQSADASRESDEHVEPILPAATTISSAPPAIVDRRIDCIVPIRLNGPVAGDKVIPLAQRLRRAGSKPVHIEGKLEGGAWELLQNGARYEELRAAAQLANRSGALNELEFSEFVTGVQQFADALDASPEFPDMLETVAMARELDAFAAQCDAQLSINVLSDGAPWSANYVQAVASQDGLLLSRDGTRFVKLDARQSPVFMLQFGDTNFLRDDLTYKGGQMITLVLDVPVADEDILPFRLMCDYAKSLAERIGGRVVDDGRRPLPETALLAIEKQLMTLYAKLEQAGIPAGSPATRRLFSQ
ncbi:Cell division protein ZipA [Paraburkholderia graminis C4D1M]|jgi:FtsZ-interacting cell division protein ZipA|uniref:Cell division protein ZipA n=1 Tax=Paraburkholderia graminis (strain ATCC 700544 / DSM 17151 / LMG 18924 / NCIMB 13744 / C4D1M) TaxID=396598 RepID=B1FYX3_PARG4|nr:cell division protein ZipA C-terminal FtsZ-binding domain-containing protein [Paraburkholderia graminis]EDT10730.1 ZipA FtsZ-binding region [Paraburkholderia graminis C4D1M]CAB3716562.1 Cell division protein ZipA [Paraburkholderia graminis C4D1M]